MGKDARTTMSSVPDLLALVADPSVTFKTTGKISGNGYISGVIIQNKKGGNTSKK
ncbi:MULTISPECIES: hypothetical protein [Photorhabdus]|uniref:hypothetical protein n=1 Tax=Photorhabdus TaxID=29487 RepID=UPI0013969001|nr:MULTISPECIES: hypothetical protein [Photorhabdus]